MSPRHFLTLKDLPAAELHAIVERAIELKRNPAAAADLQGRTLALLFEKASTRTRLAFEVAMAQMGGVAIFLSSASSQLGRGEPIEDTARVMSRMADCVAVRTFAHERLETFARHSRVPVINALSDTAHPCQLLADVQTFREHRGDIQGRRVAWVGDGNNVCHSWINAAGLFDFELTVASPAGFEPRADLVAAERGRVSLLREPTAAVRDVDLVVTDTWASMGQEQQQARRASAFADYQVTPALMALARPDALFMHCLPAHRGEEVSAAVIDGKQSVVWDEAENRMHSQKALLEALLAT